MFRDSLPCKIEKRWGCYQHGFNCHNQEPRPTIGVVIGKEAPKTKTVKDWEKE
jgi:hypothetical protein